LRTERIDEIALPRRSGRLATMAYLMPAAPNDEDDRSRAAIRHELGEVADFLRTAEGT
jgi:hypothetical protein